MIFRNPQKASEKKYDLIIIGGGIYGVMLAFESGLRGLSALLLEKDDFGAHTSFNSLRILHGGLRYLQKLDLSRFRESVQERSWFLAHFPKLTAPLPCLMPLYGSGMRRPSIFKIALWLNDLLSRNRNAQISPGNQLQDGRIILAEETIKLFPNVDQANLRGGAIWYDACMPDSQILLIEILSEACNKGATALNYFQAIKLETKNGRVEGIFARDKETGEKYFFKTKCVINSAGPWCREVATKFDRDYPDLFHSSIAWNILFDRAALSNHALALTPKKKISQTYFLFPWKGMILAGTGHQTYAGKKENPRPSEIQIKNFISDLNLAVPGLNLQENNILRIFSGLLPATEADSAQLSTREVIYDHRKAGEIQGLFSIAGVKFTTSRLIAEKTLQLAFPNLPRGGGHSNFKKRGGFENNEGIFDFSWTPSPSETSWETCISKLIKNKSVLHLDDLILRRTNLGDNPLRAMDLARKLCSFFDWNEQRQDEEVDRLKKYFQIHS